MASIISSDEESVPKPSTSKQPMPRPRPRPKKPASEILTPSRKRSRDGEILSPSKQTDAFFSNSTTDWANVAVVSSDDEKVSPSQSRLKPKTSPSSKRKPAVNISSGESSKSTSQVISDNEHDIPRSASHTPPLPSDILERVGSAIKNHVASRADPFAHIRSQSPEILSPSVLNAELEAMASKLVRRSTDETNSSDIVVIAVTSGTFLVPPASDPDIIGPKDIRVGIKMRLDQQFQKVCDEITRIWERSLEVILLTDDKRRIFPHSTPANLRLKTGAMIHVHVYTRKGFEILEEQEQKERERRLNNIGKVEANVDDTQLLEEPSSSVAAIKLTLRPKDGRDIKVRIAKSSAIATVISTYKRLQNLPATANVGLVLDGETVDSNETIDGLDLEDGDMLEVRLVTP